MAWGKRLVTESPATDATSQNRGIVCFEDQKIRISLWFILIFFALHFWGENGEWGGKLRAHSLRENTTKESSGWRFEPRTCYWGPSHMVPSVLIIGPINKIPTTCHQQLYSALIRHLLCWMIRDQIEHVCSAVRLSYIRNPQGAVICSWLSKVLHSAHEWWLEQDSGTVEDISETQGQVQMLR